MSLVSASRYGQYAKAIAAISAGRLVPLYVLWGDPYLVARVTDAIRGQVLPAGSDFDEMRLDGAALTPDHLRTAVRTVSFLGGRRLVIVERGRLFKPKAGGASSGMAEEIEERPAQDVASVGGWEAALTGLPEATCLVIQAESAPDSRLRLTKLAANYGGMVDCGISGRDGQATVNEVVREMAAELGISLDYRSTGMLLNTVGTDCGLLVRELEKLSLYCADRKVTSDDILLLCPRTAEADIWQLLDALQAGKAEEAVRVLRSAFGRGESPVALVASLASQIRIMARARERTDAGVSAGALPGVLGANKFWVDQSLRRARQFSLTALYRCLRELARIDLAIKTGARDPEMAVENLVLALCAARRAR